MMRRAALLLLAAACQPAPRSGSADAAPPAASAAQGNGGIALRLHPSLPPHRFVIHARGSYMDSVVVTGAGGARHRLRPHENGLPEGSEHLPRLSTIDLDFDGYADVALLTRVALANSWSEYWRYHPESGGFARLGEFPTLRPDSAARELTAFNRGGHGGRMWTAWRYRLMDARIQVLREEAQDFLDGPGRYVRITRELRGMDLAEVRRDTLEEHEVRAGPSWEQEP